MEHSPANADAVTVGETRLHAQIAADETYSPERMGDLRRNADSQLFECRSTIGHQAFTARFVDGRLGPVRHDYLETALTRRDGGSQTSGSAANHENIRCSYHCSNKSSEQKPGPMAAINPNVPGAGGRCFMTSSSTTGTDADDKSPIFFGQSQEASS